MTVLTDGFATTISIAGTILKEKEVTPPGISGGGKNDTTTHRNTAWRTAMPKKLKELTEMSFTCSYDPKAYSDLLTDINKNQEITITFPDGATLAFWGWLDEFSPKGHKEGEAPEADVKIQCGNMDNSGNEVAPTYEAGTTTTAGG